MEPAELFKLAEGIVILASLMALAYSVFKSKSTESTVREQSELIKIQGDIIDQCVDIANTAWCDGNWDSNLRTISIEHEGGGVRGNTA